MAEASGSGATPDADGMVQDRRQRITDSVPASRVAQKPVPQAQTQDPREFQLGQIRRRFSPKETVQHSGTVLKFSLTPSDPDFPFEMTALECLLNIPNGYPRSRPTLKVGNKDIPRGFAFNVETGFEGLVQEKPSSTLLDLMKALDKNLETFLSAPKAETVKLVPNKDTRHLAALPSRSVDPIIPAKPEQSNPAPFVAKDVPIKVQAAPSFTAAQKTEAAWRREAETRQLEARMGRLPLFKKSSDGIAYTIPIEPRKRTELPISLQSIKSVQLFVPLLYPLQPCRIQLDGVEQGESKPVEKGLDQKVSQQKELTLMSHINHLAQNMHILAKTILEPDKPVPPPQPPSEETTTAPSPKGKELEGYQDAERSHIQHITRPPEWTVIDSDDAEDTDSDNVYSYDTGDESSEFEEGGVELKHGAESSQATANQEKGTAISFPFIELYGIELLEIVNLNITVKCERCKEVMEIKGLKNGITKSESCKKCASALSIGFRRDLVHAHAVRAGFLDMEGCVIVDMLPRYIPFPFPKPPLLSFLIANIC